MQEANKKLYLDLVDRIVDRSLEDLSDLLIDGFRSHAGGADTVGRDAKAAELRAFRDAFPNLAIEPHEVIADGDYVAVYGTVRGTQEGEYLDVPAVGRSFDVHYTDIFRVEDGRLAEQWTVLEVTSMLAQLGREPDASDQREKNVSIYEEFLACLATEGLVELDRLLSPDYVSHAFPSAPGPEGEREIVRSFRASFPDFKYTVRALVSDGDMVATVGYVTGTQEAEFMGTPANGKKFGVLAVDHTRIEGGVLIDHFGAFEDERMLEQLGTSPS